MKKMKKAILLYFVLLLGISSSFAQDTIVNKLFLTGKYDGEKIILRWAPGDAGTWHMSNTQGYKLERLEFTDSTDFFENGFKNMTSAAIKPWPLADWETIANKESGDRYAAIAAQTIWGKRNKSDPKNIDASFWEKSNELENLYGMCLLSADYSANAALASGLRYEDSNIDIGKTYIYRLSSLAGSIDYPIDTAVFYIKPINKEIAIPLEISTFKESENAIEILWKRGFNEYFSGYFIEKSDNGGQSFYRLNESPFIDSKTEDNNVSEEFNTYIDSVGKNYIKHQYRIVGINTFAEYSSPSKVITAMGRDRTPPDAPQNIKAEEIGKQKMLISWQYYDTSDDIKGFLISRSEGIRGEEVALTNDFLSKDTRSFIDTSYDETINNWYLVYAVDTAGNANVAFPEYGSIIDSIPPAPPQGLSGTIDSNGVVNIKWNLGSEKDISGYKLFFANQDDHVYMNVNNIPIRDTVFTDSIPLNVLTEDIYYKVVAVDMVGNTSGFSKTIKLKKPDIVAPESPVFIDYKVTEKGIKLKWAMSTSHDVVMHYLYRREVETERWDLIYRENKNAYIDDGTIPNKEYEYKILAQDDDGLFSELSFTIQLTAIDFKDLIPVKDIYAKYNKESNTIKISWNYAKQGDFSAMLFKAIGKGSFEFVKQVDLSLNEVIDTDIRTGNTYEYVIQVKDKNKKESGFSPIAKVNLINIKE